MWLISAPLLGALYYGQNKSLGVIDFIGIFLGLPDSFLKLEVIINLPGSKLMPEIKEK